MEWAECVSRAPVFKAVRAECPEFCAAVAERLVERRYAPKQLILERGSRTEELAFICEGCVHICWALEESCLAELRAGDMLGEVEVLSGADFKAFAVAAGRVETALLVITKADLEACLDQHQSVKLAVRIGIAQLGWQRNHRSKSRNEATALWTHSMDSPQQLVECSVLFRQCAHDEQGGSAAVVRRWVGPAIGVLPFIVPLSGNPGEWAPGNATIYECALSCSDEACESQGSGSSSQSSFATAHCSQIADGPLVYMLVIWWAGCALFMLEFCRIQFHSIGFGQHPRHWLFMTVVSSAVSSAAMLAYRENISDVWDVLKVGFPIILGSGSATLFALLAYLVWHAEHLDVQTAAATTIQRVTRGWLARQHQQETEEASMEDHIHAVEVRRVHRELSGQVDRQERAPLRFDDSPALASIHEQAVAHISGLARDRSIGRVTATKAAANRWRRQSKSSDEAKRALWRASLWFCLGVSLLLLNWAWLQAFVMLYHTASGDWLGVSRNLVFSTMFELVSGPFKAASSRCFKNAETYRFGSKEHITFDRFHLVNSVKCAFILYSAIFKITLMASQKDVVALVTWVLPKLLLTVLKFCAKMRDWHSVEQKRAAGRLAARLLSRNLLERRGQVCFETSLQMTSASIAAVQYLVFLSVLRLNGLFYTPPDAGVDDWAGNVYVFPYLRDSLEAAAFKQQVMYVLASWLSEYLLFVCIDAVSGKLFQITPSYVGSCHLKDYPRYSRTILCLAAHIVSDVYLGMVLVTLAVARE